MSGAAIPSPEGDRRAVSVPGHARPGRRPGGPVLTTPRLVLRPVEAGDLEELFGLHSDPRAFAEDLTTPLSTREQMHWVLERWVQHWREHGTGYVTVRARTHPSAASGPADDLLGVVGLSVLGASEAAERLCLSAYWRLHPSATGRGVAAEAMRAVLGHPAIGPRGREVIAVTAAGNTPSRTLAAQLGFVLAPPSRPVPGGRAGDVLLVRGR